MKRPGPVVIDSEDIHMKVSELGKCIANEYSGVTGRPLLVGVLRGAAYFTADLARSASGRFDLDWLWVSTYGSGTTRSEVSLVKETALSVEGRHVLLVDDIFDSGSTLQWLADYMLARRAASVRTCVLLRKVGASIVDLQPDFVGYAVDVDWVAGYGIDHSDNHRSWPDIHSIDIF